MMVDGLDTHALADREREKYSRMWAHEQYHRISPGHLVVADAVKLLRMEPGASVLDWGCGLARATTWLRSQGYDARGMDHLDVREDETVPFVECPLWNPSPDLEATDYAFCVDVMEHVPEPVVPDTLRVIRRYTRRGAYFRISTVPDGCGELIGEKLHLTIRPIAWWAEQISRAGYSVQHMKRFETACEFVARVGQERKRE